MPLHKTLVTRLWRRCICGHPYGRHLNSNLPKGAGACDWFGGGIWMGIGPDHQIHCMKFRAAKKRKKAVRHATL